MAEPMVVIATPTIMDGLVVRWHRSESAAENGSELMSASRNGIQVHCYLHQVPEDVLATARWAHEQLAAGRAYEEVQALATHRYKYLLGHEIEPMPKAVSGQ